jgi:hypothetical protein
LLSWENPDHVYELAKSALVHNHDHMYQLLRNNKQKMHSMLEQCVPTQHQLT